MRTGLKNNMILHEFLSYCSSFIRQSVRDNKNWKLVSVDGYPYLSLRKSLPLQASLEKSVAVVDGIFSDLRVDADPCRAKDNAGELCSIEYHVVFNESYGVPVLLFNIHREYRGRMNMEEAWNVLELCKEARPSKQYETLTMVEHPLLFRPFLCLHPCKTMDILGSLESENPIITFLSTYGRFVSLNTEDLPYFESEFDDDEDEHCVRG